MVELTSKAVRIGLFLSGNFWLLTKYPYQLYAKNDFLCDLVLADFVSLGICPFHLSYLICWFAIVHSTLLYPFFPTKFVVISFLKLS